MFVFFFTSPWLGHGRKLELFIACVCMSYGLQTLLIPGATGESQATRFLVELGLASYVPYPFLLIGVLSGAGLWCNIKGWRYSRTLRCAGALLATFSMAFYSYNYYAASATATLGFHFAVWCAIFASTIIAKAVGNKPTPGAPGTK